MKVSIIAPAFLAVLIPSIVSAAHIEADRLRRQESSTDSASATAAAETSSASTSAGATSASATDSSSSSGLTPIAGQSSSTGSTSTSSTASADGSFPTDIGYLGDFTEASVVPFLVQDDNLNGTHGNSPYENRYNATDADKTEFNIYQSWGNLSPYFSSPQFDNTTAQYAKLNDSCYVEAASIFHRHGSRYPAAGEGSAPEVGALITNWTKAGNLTGSGPLSFLPNYTYELGSELLVPVGTQQLFDSGVFHYMTYGRLLNTSLPHKPVIRTPSQSRMLNSSRYWTLGFFGWDAPDKINLEVIIESDNFNSTLSPYDDCPGSDNITIAEEYLTPKWIPTYLANATSRLQQYTNLNLTADIVYGMQSLCPYEVNTMGYSNFCQLFTEEEWRGFEYSLDLGFQGDYGFMSPSGKAQGVGYAQELLSRLQNQTFSGPVTTQNSTLDNSSTYFPIDQPLYVDFTHDDVILSVLTALNYTQFNAYLNATSMDANRNFVLSHIAPFGARLVFETIYCTDSSSTSSNSTSSNSTATTTGGTRYLRTKLNEGIIPMTPDQGCPTSRPDGLCNLDDFVSYQNRTLVPAANFDKTCFGINGTDYTITGPSVRNGTLG